ncbi:transcription elongation factor spt6 [Purpureocillium lavendulum]|uniref:Transcription elongation factor spt6 n=1 Tax=Purpureocillium lavendulum TaxID=1247861 RepID=A0AB34FYB2_9HYPO|nr:transcription elongation factor spt6 [Purpureocillium lavendulum]
MRDMFLWARIGLLIAAAGVGALPAHDGQPLFSNSSSSIASVASSRTLPTWNATSILTSHGSKSSSTPCKTTHVRVTVTSTVTANKFGFSGEQTATFHSAETTATLAPNIHWGQDTKKVTNVVPIPPEKGSQLYYGNGDPSKKGQFGMITYNFISPSVNLDHSDHVTTHYDENDGLKVRFSNEDAFNHARNTWNPADKGLVLIAYTSGCEGHRNGERCFFKCSKVSVDRKKMTITAACQVRDPNDIISSAESQWGEWTPSKKPIKPGDDVCAATMDQESTAFYQRISTVGDLTCANNLGRRSFWSWVDDNVIKPVENEVKNLLDELSLGESFSKDLSFKFPNSDPGKGLSKLINPKTKQAVSPWGDSVLLLSAGSGPYGSLNVYCVGCGASGTVKLGGKFKWKPLEGFTEGAIELHVDARIVLKIGVDAQVQYKKDYRTDLFDYGLPGLSFGVVTIGPSLSLGANVMVDVEARGRLLAGAEMGLQDAHVVLDLVNPSRNSVGNWWPYFKPVLKAEGELKVAASLGLPLAVNCGIRILTFKKVVSLIEEPSIKVSARYAGSKDIFGRMSRRTLDTVGTCEGVQTDQSWRNMVVADASAIGLGKSTLADSDDQLLDRQCIPMGESLPTDTAAYDVKPVPDGKYSHSNGLEYSPLTDLSASIKVVSCSDGDMYAIRADASERPGCSSEWATHPDNTVVSDGTRRMMHYSSDTMKAAGVSRLSVSTCNDLPDKGVWTALVAYDDKMTAAAPRYVAVDPYKHVFYPIVCEFADRNGTQVFLADDPAKGVETLQSDKVIDTVTGSKVYKCQSLVLSPARPKRSC